MPRNPYENIACERILLYNSDIGGDFLRFIHIADIHLGATPDSQMPWGIDRGRELWDSFYRLLDEVEASGTDLLLIAGDLFHRQPLKRELKELDYRFSQLSHTQVVIIAGNHDYIGRQSFYRDFEWSDNVMFFRKNHVSYIYLSDLNTIVYGMSYDRTEIGEPIYDNLRPMRRFKDGTAVSEDCRHILLGHGGDANHIPINIAQLKDAGFDYVALGHIHKPWLAEEEKLGWSGALEPIDRGDEGEHGYIRGTIDAEGTHSCFVPFAERSYRTLRVQMGEDMTMGALTDSVRNQIEAMSVEHMYRIVLEGFRSVDFELDEERLLRLGRILDVKDETTPNFDYERLYTENRNNIIGLYIQKINEMDVSDSQKEKALYYGMKAFFSS